MTTPTDSELDARVARGAALFDEKYPGWAGRINLQTLDVGDTQYCPAAQVVCNSATNDAYEYAMDELGYSVWGQTPSNYGFVLTPAEGMARDQEFDLDGDATAIYAPLTAAWRRAIDARLTGAAS